ncbi:PPE domain-containing protein [Umezawaea beigongshangensis]|uniref:PPE domain-containing protein n=1 Tax=Umezawaea beigongshangensis TaxID=2780383 RepID=UPI0018F17223|nr:PPE domain-containing protein [Umezawaea beigongshangensis]
MGGYNYNFNAQSHEALYDKIRGTEGGLLSGVGRSVQTAFAAQATDDAWNSFRAVMGNAKAEVQQAVIDSGAVWEGTAGESFTGAAAPLVQWAEDARAAGVATHHSVQAQQSHYTSARTEMPEPIVVSSTANDDFLGIPAGLTHLVGGQTDQDVEEGRANAAKAAAVQVMNSYQSGASSAVFSVGVFTPPPQVVTQVVEPETLVSTEQQQNIDRYDEAYNRNSRGLDPSTASVQTDQRQTVPTQQQRDDATAGTSDAGDPERRDSTPGDTTSTTGTTGTTGTTLPQQTPPPAPVVPPPGGPTPPPHQSPLSGPGLLGTRSPGAPPGTHSPGGSRVPNSALGGARGTGSTGSGTRPGVPGQFPGQQPGRGITPGVGAPGVGAPGGDSHTTGRSGAPGATSRGGAGSPGAPGVAAGPQRGQGDEDTEHKAAAYLQEIDDIWGENDTLVAPPVIGDFER